MPQIETNLFVPNKLPFCDKVTFKKLSKIHHNSLFPLIEFISIGTDIVELVPEDSSSSFLNLLAKNMYFKFIKYIFSPLLQFALSLVEYVALREYLVKYDEATYSINFLSKQMDYFLKTHLDDCFQKLVGKNFKKTHENMKEKLHEFRTREMLCYNANGILIEDNYNIMFNDEDKKLYEYLKEYDVLYNLYDLNDSRRSTLKKLIFIQNVALTGYALSIYSSLFCPIFSIFGIGIGIGIGIVSRLIAIILKESYACFRYKRNQYRNKSYLIQQKACELTLEKVFGINWENKELRPYFDDQITGIPSWMLKRLDMSDIRFEKSHNSSPILHRIHSSIELPKKTLNDVDNLVKEINNIIKNISANIEFIEFKKYLNNVNIDDKELISLFIFDKIVNHNFKKSGFTSFANFNKSSYAVKKECENISNLFIQKGSELPAYDPTDLNNHLKHMKLENISRCVGDFTGTKLQKYKVKLSDKQSLLEDNASQTEIKNQEAINMKFVSDVGKSFQNHMLEMI